jgi:Protein of unknown function (DUF1616)
MAKRNGLIDKSKASKSGSDQSKSPRGPVAIQNDVKKLSIEELALQKCTSGTIDLADLVREIESELGYGRDRVLQRILEMKDNKKIRLKEATPYSSFVAYLFSPFSMWFWLATAAVLLSCLLIFVSSGFGLYLRYVFGGLLVLFLPGYALVELLYAKRNELEDLVRVALSIGLTLALAALIGLALNYTPFGIRLYPVEASLAIVTEIFLLGAVQRKHVYYKLLKDIP